MQHPCRHILPKDMYKMDKYDYVHRGICILKCLCYIPTLFPDYWCFAIPALSISVMHILAAGACLHGRLPFTTEQLKFVLTGFLVDIGHLQWMKNQWLRNIC